MKKIIRDIRPKTRFYKFTHPNCCEFVASGDEFEWTHNCYNEKMASVICPLCGKQFYQDDPELVSPNSIDQS